MNRPFCILLLLLSIFAISFPLASASRGDRSIPFHNCVDPCIALCPPSSNSLNSLFTWSCSDNCIYDCVHSVSDARAAASLPAQQFFGKWPLRRIASLQEPASVIFSLANLLPHLRWAFTWSHRKYPRRYLLLSLVGCNAWICSAIFHSRDRWYTERIDYAGAQLLLGFQLHFALFRTLNLVKASQVHNVIATIFVITIWITGANRAGIFSYKIKYSENIIFGIVLGVLTALTWVVFAILARKIQHPRPYTPLFLILYVFLASALELYEFPNGSLYRIFDAHSLWHFATIPISHWYYSFLLSDFDYRHHNIYNTDHIKVKL